MDPPEINSKIIVWPKYIKWKNTRTPVIQVEEDKFENPLTALKKYKRRKLNETS